MCICIYTTYKLTSLVHALPVSLSSSSHVTVSTYSFAVFAAYMKMGACSVGVPSGRSAWRLMYSILYMSTMADDIIYVNISVHTYTCPIKYT